MTRPDGPASPDGVAACEGQAGAEGVRVEATEVEWVTWQGRTMQLRIVSPGVAPKHFARVQGRYFDDGAWQDLTGTAALGQLMSAVIDASDREDEQQAQLRADLDAARERVDELEAMVRRCQEAWRSAPEGTAKVYGPGPWVAAARALLTAPLPEAKS